MILLQPERRQTTRFDRTSTVFLPGNGTIVCLLEFFLGAALVGVWWGVPKNIVSIFVRSWREACTRRRGRGSVRPVVAGRTTDCTLRHGRSGRSASTARHNTAWRGTTHRECHSPGVWGCLVFDSIPFDSIRCYRGLVVFVLSGGVCVTTTILRRSNTQRRARCSLEE